MNESAPAITHLTREQLDAGLDHIRSAPTSQGTLDLVLRRPATDEREVLDEAELSLSEGVVGDNWNQLPSKRTEDGGPHPDMQLNIMNSRVTALIAQDPDRWKLAGDQLYIDLDVSAENLPAGTKLSIGDAVIEITDQPHTGCAKFTRRFGLEAYRWVNSDEGMALRLRGVNAKVTTPGTVRPGDTVTKL